MSNNINDFGRIQSDYEFFIEHSTEAEAHAKDYVAETVELAQQFATLRVLDFGCGAGGFTSRFLTSIDWASRDLELSLVEPVDQQLRQAAEALARFSERPVAMYSDLPEDLTSEFDFILANHSLYFVDDVDAHLADMVSLLGPFGRLFIGMAGMDNFLVKLWETGFRSIGKSVPYHTAEDVRRALQGMHSEFRESKSYYDIRFSDTSENRMKIVRFLFDRHLEHVSIDPLLQTFDEFSNSGSIDISTFSYHFYATADA